MRIAIDGMLLGRRSSGVEGSIANLVQDLAAAENHDYTLFASSDEFASDRVVKQGDAEAAHLLEGAAPSAPQPTKTAVTAHRPPSELSPRFRVLGTRWPVQFRPLRILWQQIALPMALARGGFDLLHAPGYVAPLLAPLPVVLTLYDTLALSHPGLCTVGNRWHYRFMVPLSARRAAAVIVPSETTRRDVERFMPWATARIRVIPLGVDKRFSVLQDEAATRRLQTTYGLTGPYILFVGGLEPKKNLARLIGAFHLLKQRRDLPHRLVLAGAPSWDRSDVERAIRETGLGEAVLLPGFVPPDLLPALYRGAELFVFPSLYEGFGLPPLEAMACGTPVIVSDRGALPEIAGPGALAVNPLMTSDIAEAMESVLTQCDVRTELIARGLRRAAEFSWDRVAAATEAVYAEVAGGRRPA